MTGRVNRFRGYERELLGTVCPLREPFSDMWWDISSDNERLWAVCYTIVFFYPVFWIICIVECLFLIFMVLWINKFDLGDQTIFLWHVKSMFLEFLSPHVWACAHGSGGHTASLGFDYNLRIRIYLKFLSLNFLISFSLTLYFQIHGVYVCVCVCVLHFLHSMACVLCLLVLLDYTKATLQHFILLLLAETLNDESS